MRARLLIATFCIFAFPLFASPSKAPQREFLSATAMAGHTVAGAYCDCGTRNCICDTRVNPTTPAGNVNEVTVIPVQTGSSDSTFSNSDAGLGVLFGALLIALMFRITF